MPSGPVSTRSRWVLAGPELALPAAARLVGSRTARRLGAWPLRLLALLPPALAAWYIHSYAVNVVVWDEWESVRLLERWQAGTWTFHDLWAQHNEHRPLFPRLWTLATWRWTHLDSRAGMWATWGLLCLTAVVLFRMLARPAAERERTWIWFLPVSWLLFNWRQSENFLLGVQVVTSLMVLAFVFAVYALGRAESLDRHLGAAVGSGVVGTLSFANGLLVWPIGLLQLVLQRRVRSAGDDGTRRGWRPIAVWVLAGVAVHVLYLHEYYKPGHHPRLSFFVEHPLAAIRYFLVYWGHPLAGRSHALVAGALLLAVQTGVLAIVILRQQRSVRALQCLSLFLFAVLSGAMLTVARGAFGAGQAAAPRYVLFAAFGLIGALGALGLIEASAPRRGLAALLGGALVLSVPASYLDGSRLARREWAARGELAFFLRSHTCQRDRTLARLYPDPRVVQARVPFLEQHRLNVFHRRQAIECRADGPHPVSPTPGHGGHAVVESINGQRAGAEAVVTIDSTRDPVLRVTGWAVDRAAGGPPAAIFVRVESLSREFPAETGRERLDVARALDEPAFWHSGFVASVPTAALGAGTHRLRVKVVSADRRHYSVSPRAWTLVLQ